MAQYRIKPEYAAAVQSGAVASFTSPIQGIGFHLTLAEATQEQLEKLYLLSHPFVEKIDDKPKKSE